jgi:hypothetical protein
MASYDGVPSIRLEGDEKRALALISEGKLLLSKAQAFTKRAGVPTYSMSRRVSDDEYVYVLVAGGQSIIQISAGVKYPDLVHREPEEKFEDSEFSTYPDFLSGLVFNGILDTREETAADGSKISYTVIRSWAPTPNCAKIQEIDTGRQPSRRLAVRPHITMDDWNNKADISGTIEYSQNVVPRTSDWSGTMKKVVQIVFGLGRINKNRLRDPDRPDTTTQYMNDVDQNGVQVQYDYKFMRTHGIYRGPDNTLWLVEISSTKGVIAMPLPIFPGSDKPVFAERARDRGDTAMQTALDELGCLPTGEGFPTGKTFEEKLANGDILRLLSPADLQDFYRLSAYSSVCGWAFNEKGNEAHNVGYTWPDNDVFQKGYWYQINIDIGPVNKNRKPGQPIANGSASLRKQQEGYLYSPPVKNSFIPVKYYEPLLPGLLSHSAKPTGPSTRVVDCDTVVFVAFMNGDLKTARYFKLGRPERHESVEDERRGEECLLEGSWSWKTTTGSRSLPAMPYTNDIDPRSVLEDHVLEGTLTSSTLGYDPPSFSDFIDAPESCVVVRYKVWKQVTAQEERGGEARSACFMVPAHSREAYYYFEGHWYNGGKRGSMLVDYAYVLDPYVYYGWRKFPRISSTSYPSGRDCRTDKCGGKHTERRIICWEYSEHQCHDYADGGPWAEECQNIESLCSAKPPQRRSTYESWDKGADFKGTWNFVSDGLNGPASGPTTMNQHEYAMVPSPDPETGLTQYIFAEHSAIGEDCVIYTKGFGDRVVTGYTPEPLAQNDGMPLFIGVNQP